MIHSVIFPLFFKFIVLISFLFSVHTITVDVKPSNILVSTRGQVKLCDFGVSRQVYDYVVLSDKNLPNWFGVYPYLTSNFTVFFLLIQLVNSIATTYVGTHAYMAVRFSTFLPCNEDVPTVI